MDKKGGKREKFISRSINEDKFVSKRSNGVTFKTRNIQ